MKLLLQLKTSITKVGDSHALLGIRVPCNHSCRGSKCMFAHEGVAVQVYQYLHKVCSNTLIITPINLGVNQSIVQVDESLFRHKPKYHQGQTTSREHWVFGLIDTSTKLNQQLDTWK